MDIDIHKYYGYEHTLHIHRKNIHCTQCRGEQVRIKISKTKIHYLSYLLFQWILYGWGYAEMHETLDGLLG